MPESRSRITDHPQLLRYTIPLFAEWKKIPTSFYQPNTAGVPDRFFAGVEQAGMHLLFPFQCI